jgi:tetratricopeptide (TPR) repeat protein
MIDVAHRQHELAESCLIADHGAAAQLLGKQLIERALEMTPGDPFLIDSLGWVEYRLGNLEAALRWLTQAYRSRPDTEIAAHLGEVLWVMGKRDEARRVWAEARARDAIATLRTRIEQLARDSDRESALNRDAGDSMARLDWEAREIARAAEGHEARLDQAALAAHQFALRKHPLVGHVELLNLASL